MRAFAPAVSRRRPTCGHHVDIMWNIMEGSAELLQGTGGYFTVYGMFSVFTHFQCELYALVSSVSWK